MNEFQNKYHEANLNEEIDTSQPLTRWYGHPRDLPLAYRQELIYRYQFLDESTNTLAREYRVTPIALQEWLTEHEIEIQRLETDEDIALFESHVNATYKDLRVRMSGLVALHSAKAWHSLALSGDHLLNSLELASYKAHEQAKVGLLEIKSLKQLTDTHAKMTERQELIKQAISVPAERDLKNITDGFQKSLEDLFNEISNEGDSYKLPNRE